MQHVHVVYITFFSILTVLLSVFIVVVYMLTNRIPQIKSCELNTSFLAGEGRRQKVNSGKCLNAGSEYGYYHPEGLEEGLEEGLKEGLEEGNLLGVVFLRIENISSTDGTSDVESIHEDVRWLIDYLTQYMGFIVIVSTIENDASKIIDRIYKKKDSNQGIDTSKMSKVWAYIGFLIFEEPPLLPFGKFAKVIYIQPPKFYTLPIYIDVLVINTAYNCCMREEKKFPLLTSNTFVRIHGTTSGTAYRYSNSCNWSMKKCDNCSYSFFILQRTCQQSITKYIIDMYLTDRSKFSLELMTKSGSNEPSDVKINEQQSILLLTYTK